MTFSWKRNGANLMEAKLGVTTCDKCEQPMKEGQKVLVVAEGFIDEADESLNFKGSSVRYACHLACWDRVEEILEEVEV